MMINDRINKIIERENLTIASFARKINIGDQTVRSVCVMKRNRPSYEFITKIVQTFDWLNPKWLLTGEGNMEIDNREPGNYRRFDDGGSRAMVDVLNYMREKDCRFDQYLRERDAKIEQLTVESTSWRVLCENLTSQSFGSSQIAQLSQLSQLKQH